jgi:hypothetical protein
MGYINTCLGGDTQETVRSRLAKALFIADRNMWKVMPDWEVQIWKGRLIAYVPSKRLVWWAETYRFWFGYSGLIGAALFHCGVGKVGEHKWTGKES